uniref:Uncharacterized protein n=1 Tax=Anopheles albimanus TaxID=7167 RepID=A0A182FUZ7_ANOAL
MADDDKELVAGRLPAVKAGGMRIVQHKTPSNDRPAKDPVEVIGLSVSIAITFLIENRELHNVRLFFQNPAPNVNTGEVAQAAPSSKSADHSVEASQVAHAQKPPAAVHQKPVNHIQQPRK